MGYLHIDNLYKNQLILMFRECFALEKIHGTSAHISFKVNPSNKSQRQLVFFSGGEAYNRFVSLFDKDALLKAFNDMVIDAEKEVTIYGEAYGGSQQKMAHTYGRNLKFIAFDVKIGDVWLDVPKAEIFTKSLGLEFVYYEKCSLVKVKAKDGDPMGDDWKLVITNLDEIDKQRDNPSVQAKRNGILEDKLREGVVLRPLVELTLNNGDRIICKHKHPKFGETKTERQVVDPALQVVLTDSQKVSEEWVTKMRLMHVIDKIPNCGIEKMADVIRSMKEDVYREGKGEFVESKDVEKAIARQTALLFKEFLNSQIGS